MANVGGHVPWACSSGHMIIEITISGARTWLHSKEKSSAFLCFSGARSLCDPRSVSHKTQCWKFRSEVRNQSVYGRFARRMLIGRSGHHIVCLAWVRNRESDTGGLAKWFERRGVALTPRQRMGNKGSLWSALNAVVWPLFQ